MKKTVYIVAMVIIFVFIIVFYWQNATTSTTNFAFLWTTPSFSGSYFFILTMWMIEWALIVLLLQKIVKDVRNQEPEKLSL